MALAFQRDFDARHGEAVEVAPGIRRVTANNPGPFTFAGTNTYLIGTDALAVIDPGPEDEAHLAALLRAIGSARVDAILVTHTHRDHSPAARPLARATGAPVVGCGPHRPARPLGLGEDGGLDAGADRDYAPDRELADGETIAAGGATIEAVATPGHTENHLAFALHGTDALFSGDHVMAWSTTVVAPPDGSMARYMASLDRLLARPETTYLPGHGGLVTDTHAFLRGLKAHRGMRERAILEQLARGERGIPSLVAAIYRDTDPRLHAAAGLSTLAQLEWLIERGLVERRGAEFYGLAGAGSGAGSGAAAGASSPPGV